MNVTRLRDFIVAGGSLTMAEWSAMDDEERDGLAEAGEWQMRTLAMMIGTACLGPDQAAIIGGVADAGDIVARRALSEIVSEAVEKMEAK